MERDGWQVLAAEYGFHFHTMYGRAYWDESAYYQFTLQEIEDDLEDPSEEIHRMCLEVVDRVVNDDELMQRFRIPEQHWDLVRNSWKRNEPSLYSRIDLVYDGKGPAKLLENNGDTPTSLYESGFWQWLWLEDKIESGELPEEADQFNSIQEKLIDRFARLKPPVPGDSLYLSCCKDTEEDRGTVQYLEDCAVQAGLSCRFIYIEDIGHGEGDWLIDQEGGIINSLFKLYPWEFMFREEYGVLLDRAAVRFMEPPWKALVSNKAILPLLWKLFPRHPNLLPAFFENDPKASELREYVRKPIFSREGWNVSIVQSGRETYSIDGPYGEEGFILQGYQPLPRFGDNYTLIGSWLIDDQPAGISIREDTSPVTHDLSRFLPHIIK